MLVENYFHGCYCDSMLIFFFFLRSSYWLLMRFSVTLSGA